MSTSAERLSASSSKAARRRGLLAELRREPAREPTAFPLAVLVGLLGLFIADARRGGLTGGQGFLLGLIATLSASSFIDSVGAWRAAHSPSSYRLLMSGALHQRRNRSYALVAILLAGMAFLLAGVLIALFA